MCGIQFPQPAQLAGEFVLLGGSNKTVKAHFLRNTKEGKPSMKFSSRILKLFPVVCLASALWAGDKPASVTVKGYVLDSACAFTKGLEKPISGACATACAKAGSQLVILADDGNIYWPIADTTPSSGQNAKLLPFAGNKVTVTGSVYTRGGSRAIVIEHIEAQSEQKQPGAASPSK
jgi:hypothetical protein